VALKRWARTFTCPSKNPTAEGVNVRHYFRRPATWIGRTIRNLVILAGITLPLVALGASPANAAINRGATYAIAGTNCSVTVGGWMNYPNRYPGVASQVTCATRHTVQVNNQIWYAGTNNNPVLFAQSGWYTYSNAYGTREIENYRGVCAGYWNWLSGVQVYIDGVNKGSYYNSWGWWTACT
jgi:hypothetical protein